MRDFDLASLRQSPVTAANNGAVVFAGPLAIYGDAVIIDHGLGIFTLYGHLSAITTQVGATVQRGDVIGRTGETGLAGGDHLHFSVMLWGTHIDPPAHFQRVRIGDRFRKVYYAGGPMLHLSESEAAASGAEHDRTWVGRTPVWPQRGEGLLHGERRCGAAAARGGPAADEPTSFCPSTA